MSPADGLMAFVVAFFFGLVAGVLAGFARRAFSRW